MFSSGMIRGSACRTHVIPGKLMGMKITVARYSSDAASPLQQTCKAEAYRVEEENDGVLDWDSLGFGLVQTDYMYLMRCAGDGVAAGGQFADGKLGRYGNIELSPASGVLNYGQGLFEGLKAYRSSAAGAGDGRLLLFRPSENAARMQEGARRLCMPSPTVSQFLHAVKQTVLANRRWVPPAGKGALYLRPLLMGSGPVLGLAPAPEYTFMIYASPVGNYFKEGVAPINLYVEDEFHRATRGGSGCVKTISNYAPVLKAQLRAKSKGFSEVLFLDSVNKRYLEEASSCNVFVVKGDVISTPALGGTILSGITRKSIIELAFDFGYQVEEREVPVEDLMEADEVFCTGTAVVVAPVGSITYSGKRIKYRTGSGTVARRFYSMLSGIQMGLLEDKKDWTVEI